MVDEEYTDEEIQSRELTRLKFIEETQGKEARKKFAKQGIEQYGQAIKHAEEVGQGYGREYKKELENSLIVYRKEGV